MEQLSLKEHCQKFPRLTDFDHSFAQLKEFGKEAEGNLQDGLCRACARFNWRQLIGRFLDRKIGSSIKDWVDYFDFCSEENERVLAAIEDFRTHKGERDIVELGDEWPSSPKTRFPLAPLAWVTANRDICSLCGLITEAAANQENGPMVPDLEDIIAFWFGDDDRYSSSMFHVSTTRSLSQEVGDRWQLSFCFYDDGKSQIRTIREGSNKILTHPKNWFMDCISPRQIDFDIVKSWISNCEEKHRGCKDNYGPMNLKVNSIHYYMKENGGQLPDNHPHQRNMKDSAPFFNLRLIDVLKDEVIQSRGEEKYLALSYVWGTTTQYKALSKNFHKSLVEEHEIGRLSVLRLDRSVLPQTIQDAMCLVQNIGERYLWVDVLCIIQDDPNEVTSTLRFMNKIYSDATMTIVAADGSADHGLKGVRPNSRDLRSVTSSVDTIPFMQETHILDMNNTAWAQRGWTFQEGIFSKKWLIFSNSRVFFACHERVVGEEQPEEPIEVNRASRQDYEITRFIYEDPTLWVDYRTKVTLYTSRHLTYEGDVVDAFSGLMERYRELSGVLFSSCLPTNTDSLFTLALLWRSGKNRRIGAHKIVEANTQALIRRVSPVWRQGRDVFFPSWSWIGWKGPVIWDSPGGDYNYTKSLDPAVSWPWGKPNMADSRKRADEKGVLDFDAEVAILSPADLQAIDTVYLDDGTMWKEGRRKCVAIATQTLTGMVFLLIVKHGADGIYSREGVCEMAVKLWSELATREHLSLG